MYSELIEEYRSLTAVCFGTDYSNATSVKKHNKAVTRMYEIVSHLSQDASLECVNQFYELFQMSENNTNVWAAIHSLEHLTPDTLKTKKALSIIGKAAEGESAEAFGFQLWLKDWNNKSSLTSPSTP